MPFGGAVSWPRSPRSTCTKARTIEGRLQTRIWQGKQDRCATEIVAGDMQMLDGRNGGQEQGGYPSQQPRQNSRYQQAQNDNYAPPQGLP